MAPPLALPRPSWLQRIGGALGFLDAPLAQPVGYDPIDKASPEEEGAPPPEGSYSRAYGGFSIDPRWLQQLALNDDTILQREGQHDLKLYDAVLDDPTCASAFQQRRLAVVSRPWEVEPGDDSAQAEAAAEHLREQLSAMPWDRICDRMLYGIWYGYGVGEAMYKLGPDSKIWLDNIIIPDRKWFGFTNAGELRMRTAESPSGEIVPPNKFWAYRAGASHDFVPYGTGLAHWCYWPVWFKKNAIKFWAIYLEKFGMPTALGKFPDGANDDVRNNLLAAAAAVGRDSAVVIPTTMEMELLAGGRTSDGSYLQFCDEMNDGILRIILSQTGTSKSEAQGLGGSQSDVMKDVRDEVVRSDSDLLHESFNETIARWLTLWNFGPNVAAPRVYRNLEDQEDLNSLADRDTTLKGLGWIRTEDSFKEIYGEGYERAPEPEPIVPGALPGQAPGQDGNIIDLETERQKRQAEFAASGPRPLFVARWLRPSSARKLLAWAKEKGIPNLLEPSQLHVTILYSRQPVDWFKMGEDWGSSREYRIDAGGPRAVERFGDSIVLRFANDSLGYRHRRMLEAGASSDHDEFKPHVTLGSDPDKSFDIEALEEAFQDEFILGPELFEPIEEDWIGQVAAANFSAADMDRIDIWAAELARGADPIIAEFAASLKGKLRGITDANALRIALLEGLEQFPAERLGELAGLPMTAARAGAQAGLSDQLEA